VREFARLGPDLDISQDPITAVRTLAARLQCTVLLKGATTVVADADGQVRLNLTGTPWLAAGGTGDVLTGVIASLLAGGVPPLDAASGGAFLHGLAGRLAADGAPTTSAAVAEAIPDAMRALTRP
jgi:NAD(P)H-hydrate repair Nnr-like enzyme with NAD(P)H-hydrate dehydratase domain